MKKATIALSIILAVLLVVLVLFSVFLLKDRTDPWQEKYDLGMRYLSDGNYEAAALAFYAAIEIDPRRPEAYLGAAEAYIALGNYDAARDVLAQGSAATGDDSLLQRQEELPEGTQPEESVSVQTQRQLVGIIAKDEAGTVMKEYSLTYNALGQIVCVQYDTQVSNDQDHTDTMTYDGAGRLLRREHEVLYDSAYIDTMVDAMNYASAEEFLSMFGGIVYYEYSYNDAGQLIRYASNTDQSGEEITYEYDAQGLLTRSVKSYSSVEDITDYFYDSEGRLIREEETSQAMGGGEVYSHFVTTHEYDQENRLSKTIQSFDGFTYTSTYDYSYLPFVLGWSSWNDTPRGTLRICDSMDHEIFALSLDNPQLTADAEGFVIEATAEEYSGLTLTYTFVYEEIAVSQPSAEAGASTDWKAAYASYLPELLAPRESYETEVMQFYLFYLDEDDIPELWIDGGGLAAGCYLAYIHNGEARSEMFSYTMPYYLEKENIMHAGYGHQGYYGDWIFSLKDGEPDTIASGEYTEITNPADGSVVASQSEYFWNGEKVTSSQYQRALDSAFDDSSAKNFYTGDSAAYSYSEILAYLN